MSGTVVIIEDKSVKVIPYIVFGVLCVIFGVTIYVVLPTALLAENVSVILQIFFYILVGMILGLTLLTANLRGFIETGVVYGLLFWERKSMRALLRKNLLAHKHSNRMTSIIYALTLGCVIYLCVALNLLLKSVATFSSMPGCDINVAACKGCHNVTAAMVDPVLERNAFQIEDPAYVSISSYYVYNKNRGSYHICLLYTSDAADE